MRAVIVVLPSDSGGTITVTSAGTTRDLVQPGQAVHIREAGEPPSAPFAMSADQITRVFGEALAALPAAPIRFLLYFEQGTENLIPESRALLPAVLQAIRERRSTAVGIVGHTDTVGDRQFNYRLGLRRALRVQRQLQDLGVDGSILIVDSHGMDDLVVPTPPGVAELRNRRVEVTVR